METHLCLVSDQPVPNFLPVANQSTRPEKVVLAVSEKMELKAQALEKVLKNYATVERLPISNPFDLGGLEDVFLDWLGKHDQEDVSLNVTGGTKLMAIAAQEAFRSSDKPVFYVSVETDELFWIGEDRPAIKLDVKLKLKQYLEIHGYTIESSSAQELPRQWKTFSDEMFDHPDRWGMALAKLNYHAMDAEHRNDLDVGRVDANNTPQWNEMLNQLWGNEIICDCQRLKFRSPEARQFANGGWIEHKVYDIVKTLNNTIISDPQMNVTVRDQMGNRNEFDVVGLHKNRLFIVECKTKRFDKDSDSIHNAANDTIYKLDSLRKTGGLRTQGILVSFMPIDDACIERAKFYGLTVVTQDGLPALKSILKEKLL